MTHPFTVSPMTKKDIPATAEIEALCFSEPWTEASLQSTLSGDNAVLLCARVQGDDSPVGYGGIYITPPAHDAPGEASITNIAVLPAFRGRGIGRGLLLSLMDIAHTRGADDIFLEVRVSNAAAIRLYKSVGFVEVGNRKNFYRQPREDALVMRHRVVI